MVNIRWVREAGFSAGFLFVITMIALRSLHIHVGNIIVYALVMVWLCLFALFYQIAKHRHS
jgi:hypothetical protein